MAPRKKLTTSATRGKNKGKGQKKVTGKTPQSRANRQKASNARVTRSGQGSGRGRVTNASQRTSTGSARVTGSSRPALPPGKKGGALAKTTKALPAGRTTRALPPGKAGGALARTGRAGIGRVAVPLGMAAEVMSMRNRSKRDAERNKKLNRRPFEELRADNYKPNPNRRGQGSRPRKPAAKPKADPKAVAALTKPGGLFYRGPKGGGSKTTTTTKKSGGGGSSSTTTTTRRAAAPKPKPKKLTDKQRMVGKSSAERLAVWAKANRKMIEKSGTKAQKAILAKALKPKTATGGKGTNFRSNKKKKK